MKIFFFVMNIYLVTFDLSKLEIAAFSYCATFNLQIYCKPPLLR